MAGDDSQPTRFAFIEFETQAAADIALQKNGAIFKDRPIKFLIKMTKTYCYSIFIISS
jgi:RNA recognition motif-containing protein